MAIRNLRYKGDEILKKKSREIETIDEKLQTLIDDMIETMHAHDGVGLAAPQVGILKRVVVIDLNDDKGPYVIITPEIIKQGTRYGVILKAVAPSIHMIRVDVESTFEPIIGSETQSKELIDNLMKDYEADPDSVWKSEMFGRSLDNIVQEGIRGKLSLMPDNIRHKLQTTLTKVVNKGSNNMIAIVI